MVSRSPGVQAGVSDCFSVRHDVGVPKNNPVTEAQRLQFRLEAFDLLNHANWEVANSNPRSGSFRQITNNE
ncbi:MAG: hypothetical protein AUG89_02445 [Acidobacteria bacterium 13_1_20CM_4_56_7]|nr:MAG: hypothetical protein AUG89_02445 [Acidobacteria bacterium 13_1_20CM_4_56_7]